MSKIHKTTSHLLSALLLLTGLAAFLAGSRWATPATGQAMPPAAPQPAQLVQTAPVWGRKPVLGYFLFTPSLRQKLETEAGLTAPQLLTLEQIAKQEISRLDTLWQTSQSIALDESLRPAEKRQRILDGGYNQQVQAALQSSISTLQRAFDESAYTRLVDWIESQWLEERLAHGNASPASGAQSPDQPAAPNAARTYSIYATRFDVSGDAVAIPDQCIKHANNDRHLCDDSGYETGQNYSVRLHYQDSKTVEVHESGPWNVDDNYWSKLSDPQPRRLFPDLPLGMPEAQAAYFDDYNNGKDQFGRDVTAPFGIDLSDSVSIDIGLQPGHNDWIDVTFLWTDGWDSLQTDVVTLFKPTTLHPSFGAVCETFWYRIDGYNADAYLTLNVNNAADSTNWAEWKPNLPVDGQYEVWAYVPDHPSINWPCPAKLVQSDTSDARYVIHHANGERTVSGNQRPLTYMWIDLGTYTFEAGTGGKVTLSDLNGEESLSRTVSFSAMQFRRVMPPTPTPTATSTPTPTATPTPTPTPQPQAYTGFGLVQAGEAVTVPLGLNYVQPPGVGSVDLQIRYDPGVAALLGCLPDPSGVFAGTTCAPNPAISGTLQLSLTSTLGIAGDPLLAWLSFQALPTPGAFSNLDLLAPSFMNPAGTPVPIQAHGGSLCVQPCQNIAYLPVVGK